ncbi:MAG: hypothetical protein QOC96_3520 [Acidobacteriota bacterium]|jgi:hypothetical protein|nr:hypothetical protein [Acidobacteriota bacterium]
MTCLLKRFLPFALTLIVGLMLGSLLSKSTHSVDVVAPKYTGMGFGSGSGWGPHPDRDKQAPVKINYVPDIVIPDAIRRSSWEFVATLRLEAVLGADGKVSEVKPILMLPYGVTESSLDPKDPAKTLPFILNGKFVASLPYGLTEAAIEMAKNIKFIPATINGMPVSVRVTINSEFSNSRGSLDAPYYGPNAHTVIMQDGIVKWDTNPIPESPPSKSD